MPGSDDPRELREEVERLRGLLVTRDQELGEARGRIAEMESSPLFLPNLTAKVRRLVPTPIRRALARRKRG